MLWAVVWTVLVLAAVSGAVVLGRRLWRSVRALLDELRRASEVAARLGEQAERLEAAARASAAPTRPTLFDDPAEVHGRWQAVRAAAATRREARAERHRRTYAAWQRDWT
ncbi:hypothetical protein [Cellulomonas marina]|uniref:Uncharacterized protein n=1 Tax=Cellulomonas marina TaxID=988821 RepID=A0A1I0W9T8_9CELL|nr:hypothetical protein [Cellulomonas marina]GIG29081.1 hypothetical protein Cma02nite_16810 [Cellulomonas marina]SFA85381.1 hypothetical protein SAMN05421867_102300 [Cellulomonas marina]